MSQKTPQNDKKWRNGVLMVVCAASLVGSTHWKSNLGICIVSSLKSVVDAMIIGTDSLIWGPGVKKIDLFSK